MRVFSWKYSINKILYHTNNKGEKEEILFYPFLSVEVTCNAISCLS